MTKPVAPRSVVTKQKQKRDASNKVVVGIVIAAIAAAIVFIGINAFGIGAPAVDVDYANMPVTRTDDGAFVLGNPEAPFTLVVFEDYNCGHCQNYEPTIKQYIRDFVEPGLAKFEYRNLRTASPSDTIFRVVQCAGEQQPDRFFEFRSEMFNLVARNGWRDSTSPRQFAERVGVDYSQILECSQTANQVVNDELLARQVGVTGTPFVLFRNASGAIAPLPIGQAPTYSQLKAFVESQLGR